MTLPDHLTTVNTGHFAGEWHRQSDGTPVFYTTEHVKHMEHLNAQSDRLKAANRAKAAIASGAVPTKPKDTRKNRSRKQPAVMLTCECGTVFERKHGNQKSCSPACAANLYQKTQAAHINKRQDERRRLARMMATSAERKGRAA